MEMSGLNGTKYSRLEYPILESAGRKRNQSARLIQLDVQEPFGRTPSLFLQFRGDNFLEEKKKQHQSKAFSFRVLKAAACTGRQSSREWLPHVPLPPWLGIAKFDRRSITHAAPSYQEVQYSTP